LQNFKKKRENSQMPSSEQKVQECDATDDDGSNEVWLIKDLTPNPSPGERGLDSD